MLKNNQLACPPQRDHIVGQQDLPLSCPAKDMSVWCSHPRVYLEIAPGQQCICPYCGTRYIFPD